MNLLLQQRVAAAFLTARKLARARASLQVENCDDKVRRADREHSARIKMARHSVDNHREGERSMKKKRSTNSNEARVAVQGKQINGKDPRNCAKVKNLTAG